MSFVEMTNEEWEEIRRRHDAFVHTGELELQTEEIRESYPTSAAQHMTKPVERQLHELEDVVANIKY
ncbi:MAG TPA: hypothetical protein VFW60_00495 [Rhodanobacteraceae bacterium]|nr:hypothetical protein [Rhodanobacteraceae bacterium]